MAKVKVYTKTGDKGMTTLYGGSKVKKSSKRVAAYGAIDEANTFIGLAAVKVGNDDLASVLRLCQKKLFVLGAEVASDERGRRKLPEHIVEQDYTNLEILIDAFTERLPESHEFQIPGQTEKSAYLHVARAMVRKAERLMVEIRDEARLSQEAMIYMNRLSDFLFIMTRVVDELNEFSAN